MCEGVTFGSSAAGHVRFPRLPDLHAAPAARGRGRLKSSPSASCRCRPGPRRPGPLRRPGLCCSRPGPPAAWAAHPVGVLCAGSQTVRPPYALQDDVPRQRAFGPTRSAVASHGDAFDPAHHVLVRVALHRPRVHAATVVGHVRVRLEGRTRSANKRTSKQANRHARKQATKQANKQASTNRQTNT